MTMANAGLSFNAYMLATTPIRLWARARFNRSDRMPVTGLFLHRVADDHPNDWTITTRQFDRMIQWLEKNVDLVSVDEAQNRLREGNRGRVAVHISFDDGYADNCLHAVPTLLSKKIPFTYYVTTQNVRHGKPFPHDLKVGQPLAPNSMDEIRAMHDAGVEIGVHTRTHPNVADLRRVKEIEPEICGARDDLAEWIGDRPRHFAFPFGLRHNVSSRSIQLLYDEGFSSYASAYGGYNFPFDDAFHLKRFDGDPNFHRVRNWLSLDPRWVYAQRDHHHRPIQRHPRVESTPTATP